MIVIDNVLISEDVIDKQFICNLNKCKGGCCEEGDAGAPLEDEEIRIINNIFEKVKPYLTKDGLAEIARTGLKVYDEEFGWTTPTIGSNAGICVFAFRDEKDIIKCAFEQAYYDGVIDLVNIGWKKPISCHLFPITVGKPKDKSHERMNYEPRATLCKTACSLGEEMKVPVYQFLKEPIIRKYGEAFFEALDTIAKGEWEETDFKE